MLKKTSVFANSDGPPEAEVARQRGVVNNCSLAQGHYPRLASSVPLTSDCLAPNHKHYTQINSSFRLSTLPLNGRLH